MMEYLRSGKDTCPLCRFRLREADYSGLAGSEQKEEQYLLAPWLEKPYWMAGLSGHNAAQGKVITGMKKIRCISWVRTAEVRERIMAVLPPAKIWILWMLVLTMIAELLLLEKLDRLMGPFALMILLICTVVIGSTYVYWLERNPA